MLKGVSELLTLKKRILVGYDLDDNLSQLSFSQARDAEPQTLSMVEGAQQYSFPTLLARRKGQDLWTYGHQAEKLLQDEGDNCVSVSNLLSLAMEDKQVEIEGESFASAALLALFVRRTLSLIGVDVSAGEIVAIVFTVRRLTEEMSAALDRMKEYLQLPDTEIKYLEYRESFFEYVSHQPIELMEKDVLLYDYNTTSLFCNRMLHKRTADNILAWVMEEEFPDLGQDQEAFSQILEEALEQGECTSAYLIGRGFEGKWYQKGIRILCRGRRVFSGNNLYSKGACYAAISMIHPKKSPNRMIYLGKDKLKSELGIRVHQNGKESYYPLLRGGEDWFDAGGEHILLLEMDNTFTLIVSHLDHRPPREIEMILGGIPQRRNKTTKIRLKVELTQRSMVAVHIEDLGFGEIFPATHKTWHESFSLD